MSIKVYKILGQPSERFLLDRYKIPDYWNSGAIIIGLGALITNGLSYEPIAGGLTVLTPFPEFDGFFSGEYLYQYIEGYNTEIGFEDGSGVPTPERALCDCMMYDRWNIYLYEGLISYMQDAEMYNKEKLIETAAALGISRERVEEELKDAESIMY